MDIAKRLLDYGFHAPTVYFPPIVREALMIEPTETESKETLDAFAETLFRITEEPADLLHEAPHTTLDQPARRSAGRTTPQDGRADRYPSRTPRPAHALASRLGPAKRHGTAGHVCHYNPSSPCR